MRVITLVTQKGGSGKTTLASNLGVAAAEDGESVVMFDLNYQQQSLMKWAVDRKAGNPSVEQFPADKISKLPEMIKSLDGKFGTVILDTAGEDNTITHWAMAAATLCLIPLRPSKLDIDALVPTVQAIIRGGTEFAFVLNHCFPQPNNPRAFETANGLKAIGKLALPMLITRADFLDAYAAGQGVTEYAPNRPAAEAIRDLWKWVKERA